MRQAHSLLSARITLQGLSNTVDTFSLVTQYCWSITNRFFHIHGERRVFCGIIRCQEPAGSPSVSSYDWLFLVNLPRTTQFLTFVSVTHSRHSKTVTWIPQSLVQLPLAERARKDDICWQLSERDASRIPEMNRVDEDVTKVMTSHYAGQHDRSSELEKHLDKPWSHPLRQSKFPHRRNFQNLDLIWKA